ncbi:MAG: hypothetical protein RJA61_160 [Candidatus Parcubacteria bacterium]|jgi:hypothetical protein
MPPKDSLKNTFQDDEIKRALAQAKPQNTDALKKALFQSATQEITKPATPEVKGVIEEPHLIKPLRTYQGDVAEAVQTKNESVVSISLAEKKRNEDAPYTPPKNNTFIILIISAVLIFGGIFAVVITLSTRSTTDAPVVIPKPTSLISASKETEIAISEINTSNAFQTFKQKGDTLGISVGSLGALFITDPLKEEQVSPQALFQVIAPNAPAQLVRSLTDFMIGSFAKEIETETFVILTTNSFELSFSGMLGWEKTIRNDLIGFAPTNTGNFSDMFIKNKDVRVIKNTDGVIVFMYSFLNPNTIVLAQSSESFIAILNQFTTNQLVR